MGIGSCSPGCRTHDTHRNPLLGSLYPGGSRGLAGICLTNLVPPLWAVVANFAVNLFELLRSSGASRRQSQPRPVLVRLRVRRGSGSQAAPRLHVAAIINLLMQIHADICAGAHFVPPMLSATSAIVSLIALIFRTFGNSIQRFFS